MKRTKQQFYGENVLCFSLWCPTNSLSVCSLLISIAVPNNHISVWDNSRLSSSLAIVSLLPLVSSFSIRTSVVTFVEAVESSYIALSLSSTPGVHSSAGPSSASEPSLLLKREKHNTTRCCSCSFDLQAANMLLSGTSVNHRVEAEQL